MSDRYAERVRYAKPSAIREIIKVTQRPDVISFAGGLPAPELFPIEEMQQVCNEVLRENGKQALQYGTTEGYVPLREQIISKMAKLDVNSGLDNILIISGSQQGLDLTGKVFLDEGDVVICESPTYPSAINSFKAYLPKFVEVDMDDQGMNLAELEHALAANSRTKLIYTIPDFQNPSGRTMSVSKRKKLVELANQYNVIVIEDSPYIDLRFTGERLPPVKAFDTEGRVVYQGSFSKILVPGLRVGWICASREILKKYVIFKQGVDLHTSTFAQMQIAKFAERFDLQAHIHKITGIYKKRCDVMYNGIKSEFPKDVQCFQPEGGLFMWLELPAHMDAQEILGKCLENNVAFVPGNAFFPLGGHNNTLRLNFATMPEEKIIEGIARMGKVLKTV